MTAGVAMASAIAAASAAPAAAVPAAPAPAPAPAPAARPAASAAVAAPTARLAWTARIVAATAVRSRPDASARPSGRLEPVAPWNGGEVRLLVLDVRDGDGGRRWLRVRLPSRPNAAAGWIDADAAQLRSTPWRIEVDLRARRAAALRDGRRVRSWRVVVGAAATPTPRGLFAVYERVRQPAGSELGPYALHVTAHSDVLDDFGGGPGRVALHGRAGALLEDPLGSAVSHGCVRMDDGAIAWLAARAGPGTPVLIR